MSHRDCPDPMPGDRANAEAIETVIVPRAVDLGEMEVRRALPASQRQMVGPFIFLDQMGPAVFSSGEGIDVRPHPHIGLGTITYLFEGQILHRDSLGTEQAIEPGAVNWMRAGRGIVHSERTAAPLKESGQRLHGIQTWLALPEANEEDEAAFVHLEADDLPVVDERTFGARVIAGEALGVRSPLDTIGAALYVDLALRPGARVPVETVYEERAVYVTEGAVTIAGDRFEAGRLVILRPGDTLTIEADETARAVLVGGEPMGGPRYIWWNFVHSRAERIEQAKEEWSQGRFDTVPGDAEEFIPLPENAGRPRRATGGVPYP